jgi:hypothetical protein
MFTEKEIDRIILEACILGCYVCHYDRDNMGILGTYPCDLKIISNHNDLLYAVFLN